MRLNRVSLELTVLLAIIIVLVTLVTATPAIAQDEKVLHSFNRNGEDGFSPQGSLIFDAAGNLYGTTTGGGEYLAGTVFELTPQASGGWTEKLLHTFNGRDGANPQAALIFDAAGNLYGTTQWGGAYGNGTVFELKQNPEGSWTEKVLHNCTAFGAGGGQPTGGLIFDAKGNLYGTMRWGGPYRYFGTVFELSPTASGHWTEKVLHTFDGSTGDAYNPFAGLIFDAKGNLYGTTLAGGAEFGTVFELTPTASGVWTETIVHDFNGSDGFAPEGDLIFDAAGNLYGTTAQGGFFKDGVVFELTPSGGGKWAVSVLHHFYGVDGARPEGSLVFDAAGNLYGTTQVGGTDGFGTVFELNPTAGFWTEEWSSFTGADGAYAFGGLIFDAEGNLYGTTQLGGAYSYGTVFEIKPKPSSD